MAGLLIRSILVAGLVAGGAAAAPLDLGNRPTEAMAMDAGRRPAEVLAASGIKAGDTVLDMMAGEGYYTELIARTVGPRGKVVAVVPPVYFEDAKTQPAWDALVARNPKVTLLKGQPGAMALPQGLDAAFFHLTYHDLYWQSDKYKWPALDPAAFDAGLFKAVKKGGLVVIIDHVGPAGDTRAIVDKTHRIDPEVVKADLTKAGFVFVDAVPLLHVEGDDPAKLVFDPAVRGRTDRFYYRFRKP